MSRGGRPVGCLREGSCRRSSIVCNRTLCRSAYGEVTWMLVFPNSLTLRMVTLIISFCLSLVVFIVSQISKKSKTPSNPAFPNFSLEYHTNIPTERHLAPFPQGSAIAVNGATDGPVPDRTGTGWVGMSLSFSNIYWHFQKYWDLGLLDFIPVPGQVSL